MSGGGESSIRSPSTPDAAVSEELFTPVGSNTVVTTPRKDEVTETEETIVETKSYEHEETRVTVSYQCKKRDGDEIVRFNSTEQPPKLARLDDEVSSRGQKLQEYTLKAPAVIESLKETVAGVRSGAVPSEWYSCIPSPLVLTWFDPDNPAGLTFVVLAPSLCFSTDDADTAVSAPWLVK